MSTIDERIVKMQFDNSQFESRVKTTINTLANLKTALNIGTLASSFKSATSTIISQVTSMGHTLERVATSSVSGIKTLSSKVTNLGYTVKNMGTTITNSIPTSALTGMAENVESISSKFSALGTIGITALQNITNKAVDAGEKILSALTIDPLKSGFQEYETQINAVQTILANTESKGTTLEDVNNALDELNKYADQTIYNFTEMTRNIGTFTAAGVDLDTSVTAIKGIANLAAESGSTSQQASTAMYQLSQALASGTVKLQDWNSVVNAGMGGQLFQDALKETARNSGVAIDDLIEKYGSFRETLSSGWLTTDILTETLEHFANDQTAIDAATKVKTFTQLFDTLGEAMQSGWTQTWEILIGDFEEAKEFLTYLSDTFSELINASSDARNNFLESWSELGGRESLIQSAKNIIDAFLNTLNNVKKALSNIIPNVTAEQVYNITEKFREFTENLKTLSEGDFSTFTEGSQIFSKFSDIISQIVKSLRQLANSLKGSVTTAIEQVKKIFEKLISTASKLKTLLSGTFSTAVEQVKKIFEKLTPTVQKLKSLFTGTFSKAIEALSPIVDTAIEEFTKLKDVLGDKLPDIIETLFSVFGSVTDKASEFNDIFLESLGNGISSLIRKISGFISEFVELGGVSSILEIIGNVAKSAFKIFELFIESLGEAFGGMDTSAKPLYNIVERIRELTENFLNSESAGEKVKKIFKGIFSIGSIVVSVIKQIAEVLTGSFGGSVLDAAASIAGLVTQLAQTIKSSNVVKNVLNTVISVMSTVVSVVTSLISIAISEGPRIISVIISIVNAVVKFVNQFAALGGFSEIGRGINTAFTAVLKVAKLITNAFNNVFSSADTGASIVYILITKIRQLIDAFSNSDNISDTLSAVLTGLFRILKAGSNVVKTISSHFASFGTVIDSLSGVIDVLKKVFSKTSSDISGYADSFKQLGGTEKLFEGIGNAGSVLSKAMNVLSEAFSEIFTSSDKDASPIYALVNKFNDVTEKINNSGSAIENFKRIFKGAFAFFDIAITAIKSFGSILSSVFTSVTGVAEPVGSSFLNIAASIGDFIVSLDESIKESGIFETVTSKLKDIIETFGSTTSGVIEKVRSGFTDFKQLALDVFNSITQKVSGCDISFSSFGEVIKSAFRAIATVVQEVWPIIQLVGDALLELVHNISSAMGGLDINTVLELFDTGILAAGIVSIKNLITQLIDVKGEITGLKGSITGTLDSVKSALSSWQDSLKADTIMKFAGALAILAVSLILLASVDPDRLTNALVSMTTVVGELIGGLAIFSKIGALKGSAGLLMLSAAILILSGAVVKLSSLDEGVLMSSIAAIGVLMLILRSFTKAIAAADTKGLIGTAAGILIIGTSMLIFANAIERIGCLSLGQIGKGLIGIAGALAIIIATMKLMPTETHMISAGVGLIAISTAMLIMSSAIIKLSSLSLAEIGAGLLSLAGILAIVTAAVNFMPKSMVSMGIGLIAIGTAVYILSSAFTKLAALSYESVGAGVLALAGALAVITAVVNLIPNDIMIVGIGLVAVAAAVMMISSAFIELSSLSLSEVGIGLLALAGALAAIVVAVIFAQSGLAGAAVILIMAMAINMLVSPLLMLSSLSLGELGMALLSLVAIFALLGIASLVLTPMLPTMLTLVAIVAVLGVGVLALGAGAVLLGTGLLAIAGALMAVVEAAYSLCVALVDLTVLIAVSLPVIVDACTAIIEGLCVLIIQCTPAIVEALVVLIGGICEALIRSIPVLCDTLEIIIIELCEFLVDMAWYLTDAALRLLIAFLKGIADNIEMVVEVAIEIVDNLLIGLANAAVGLVEAAYQMIITLVDGIADAIDEYEPQLEESIGHLVDSIINGIFHIDDWVDAAKELGSSILGGIKSALGINSPSKEFEEVGKYSAEGYTEGLENGTDEANAAAEELGNSTKTSLFDAFASGGFDLSSLTDGMDTSALTESFLKGASGMNLDTSGLTDSMSDIDWSAYTDDSTITTAITPVIDDSEIQNGKYDAMENVTISTEGSTESITKAANTLNTDNSTYSQKIVDAVESVGDSVESGVSLSRTINNTISKITDRISDLEDAITKMQVVLDTGTLVGELSSSVDATLGTTTAMKARGV